MNQVAQIRRTFVFPPKKRLLLADRWRRIGLLGLVGGGLILRDPSLVMGGLLGASFTYNEGGRGIAAQEIDWDNDTIRCALLMSSTTCDTQNDGIVFVNGFTTVGRSDATGYADVTVAGKSTTKVDASNRTELRCSDVVFSGLGGDASLTYVGALLFKFVTNDTDSVPIAYTEFTAALAAASTQVTVPYNASAPILATSTGAP